MRIETLAIAVAVIGASCRPAEVSVEVLPPRTSVTCSAPGLNDGALGRGLVDVDATLEQHGGYVADLRFSAVGSADVRVDGIDVRLLAGTKEIALLSDVPTGDTLLAGEGDDVRRAVVENVELLPRSIAVALRDEDNDIDDVDFLTLEVEIAPLLKDVDAIPASASFALDVCKGCLVAAPTAEECPGGFARNPVCRVGQDVALFTCLSPGVAP